MLTFKALTWDDSEIIRPYLEQAPGYLCDYAPATLMMWAPYYHTEYAVWQGTLIVKNEYEPGKVGYMFPCGGDLKSAVQEIYTYHKNMYAEKPHFQTLPEEGAKEFQALFPQVTVTYNRDWEDYIYKAEDLATFAGRHYSKQRNHIHQFEKECPHYRFVRLDEENASLVHEFYLHYWEHYQKDGDSAAMEYETVQMILSDYGRYSHCGLLGGYIENDGEVIAFSIGEIKKDMLIVHVEKADIAYKGAYQVMVREFAAAYAQPGQIRLINREEDMGDEGLRKSKLSYHPTELLGKYTVAL